MDKNKHEMNNSRRNLLKKTAVIAAVTASAGLVTSANASSAKPTSTKVNNTNTQDLNACGVSGIDEPAYINVPKQAPVTEGILPLSGGAGLHYWDTGGTGPVVVLSHPNSGSEICWPYQQPEFVKQGFRVIAYSRRGRYLSPAGSVNDPGTFAGDLNALMNHLNVDKFHIIGIAAGGFVVSDYAVSYPGKLLSMVIACSLFGMWDENIRERQKFLRAEGFSEMSTELKELGPSYRWAHPEGAIQWKEIEEKSKPRGEQIRQKAQSKIDWDKLRALNIPTFFIAGGADLYQPPSMMRAAARELPGSETLVIPEVGHAVQWEHPELFNRVVTDFFKKHS